MGWVVGLGCLMSVAFDFDLAVDLACIGLVRCTHCKLIWASSPLSCGFVSQPCSCLVSCLSKHGPSTRTHHWVIRRLCPPLFACCLPTMSLLPRLGCSRRAVPSLPFVVLAVVVVLSCMSLSRCSLAPVATPFARHRACASCSLWGASLYLPFNSLATVLGHTEGDAGLAQRSGDLVRWCAWPI